MNRPTKTDWALLAAAAVIAALGAIGFTAAGIFYPVQLTAVIIFAVCWAMLFVASLHLIGWWKARS